MTTAVDPYAGRTFDIAAFQGQQSSGNVQVTQTLIGQSGQLVTGIAKLAQWFIIDFLTEQGSVPYDPTRGTGFMAALRSGRLRSDVDVFVAFGFAVGNLKAYAAAVEPATAPLDEQFAGATLLSLALSPGYLMLTIQLSSQAGTSRQVLLPVSTIV